MKNTFKLEIVYHCENGGSPFSGRVDVSDTNCANWQDVTLAYKRSDKDGVVRAFTTSFEFVEEAREVVVECLNYWCGTNMDGQEDFHGRCAGDFLRLELRILREDWTWPSTPLYKCDLDYTTAKVTRDRVTIAAVDNSLASLLKTEGGTKFNLTPFNSQAFVSPTAYTGLLPLERYYLRIEAPTGVAGDYVASSKSFKLPFDGSNRDDFTAGRSYGGRTVTEAGDKIYIISAADSGQARAAYAVFSDAAHDYQVTPRKVTFSARQNVNIRATLTWRYTAEQPVALQLVRRNSYGKVIETLATAAGVVLESGGQMLVYYEMRAVGVTLRNGDSIDVIYDGEVSSLGSLSEDYDAMVYVTMPATSIRAVANFPSITPEGIAEMLSWNITGRRTDVTGESAIRVDTESDERLARTRVFSQGWFNRGFSTDETRTFGSCELSYADFKEWMAVVFDYVPVLVDGCSVESSYIVFRPRTAVFPADNNETVHIGRDEVAEATLQVKSEYLCSRVIAGYQKHDYTQEEYRSGGFCVPVTYAPTLAPQTDKELKLQTSWHADVYAFETLMDEFDAESTDSGGLYFFLSTEDPEVVLNGLFYLPDRTDVFTSTQPDEQLARYMNGAFSPREILKRHAFEVIPALGVPRDASMRYVSQEGGNPYLRINGTAVTDGVVFTAEDYARAPRPLELTFTTSRQAWGRAFSKFLTSEGENLRDAQDRLFQVMDHEAAVLPAAYAGLVSVEADGMQYTGWVIDCKFHILHHEEVQATLLIKHIVKNDSIK